MLEDERIGGGQVVGDDDGAGLQRALGFLLGLEKVAQDALQHVQHVDLLVAQVGVCHALEGAREFLALYGQRPFGIAAPAADGLDGGIDDHRIGQDQQVGVEEAGGLRRGVGRDVIADGAQLAADAGHRLAEAIDLGFDLPVFDEVLRDLRHVLLQHMGRAQGDAVGDAGTVQG